jgi:small subunit ribosomal protein S9
LTCHIGISKPFKFIPPLERVREVDAQGWAHGIGARKTAISRVAVREGTGKLSVNGRDLDQYFPGYAARELVLEPLMVTEMIGRVDTDARVHGGGTQAQAGAIRLGVARALQSLDPHVRWSLKLAGALTRDARIVERKKTGKPKARRSKQWSKR